jgi:quinoprotein glucose dehydrogenase
MPTLIGRAAAGCRLALVGLLAAASAAVAQSDSGSGARAGAPPDIGWSSYGGDPGGMRYSPAAQINRENVARLAPAWTYRTGALAAKTDMIRKAAFETTPILVESRLVLTTPYDHVVALDPERGSRLWEYDPRVNLEREYSEVTSRGVSAWVDRTIRQGRPCRLRLYLGTLDGRLIALDGETGKPCPGFGAGGTVDLTRDAALPAEWSGGYQVTSAPAIYRDLVITGTSIADNWRVSTGRGIVRAFDARSGKLRWTWDPIPWARGTTPPTGAGNAWSTLSVDSAHDLVLVPTSSPAPDYYGGLRKGDNRWANAVVALRASTGRLVWGFQVVHHDLWDYDVAAQPTLITWHDGTPAVVINTKMGHVFVLNRLTGTPLVPVEERAVPQTDVPGEKTAPTQPFSTIALVPEKFGPEDVWGPTPADSAWCADKVKASRSEGIFTPPSLRGSVVVPGNIGGVNWGGAAYDPRRGLMFANTNRLVAWVRMIPRADYEAETGKDQDNRIYGEFGNQTPAAYGIYRTFLLSPGKVPCNRPPWGAAVAVDLSSGKRVWEVPLGTMAPGKQTGSPNLGGPMATAGGLVFTSATMDAVFRAFDAETGKELWTYQLPAGGQATPMSYSVGRTQYVVIAAGGHGKLGTKQGDYVIAFTLDGRQTP